MTFFQILTRYFPTQTQSKKNHLLINTVDCLQWRNILTIAFCFFVISACGGGGSGGSEPSAPAPTTPPPTTTTPPPSSPPPNNSGNPELNSNILANLANESLSSLENAAKALANNAYQGSRDAGIFDLESTQKIFAFAGFERYAFVPLLLTRNIQSDFIFPFSGSTTQFCSNNSVGDRATVTYSGNLDRDSNGRIYIEFRNCLIVGNPYKLDGKAALILEGKERFTTLPSVVRSYYDDLRWEVDGQRYQVSGYELSERKIGQFGNTYTKTRYLNYTVDNRFFLFDSVAETASIDNLQANYHTVAQISNRGQVYLSDKGMATFDAFLEDTNSITNQAKSIELSSTNKTRIIYDEQYQFFRYSETAESSEEFTLTTNFVDLSDLLTLNSWRLKKLVSNDDFSIPPQISITNVENRANLISSEDIVAFTSFEDPDSNPNALDVKYEWLINGELLPEVQNEVLPAFSAVFGDEISVRAIVSDSLNTVTGSFYVFTLKDAPYMFNSMEIPSIANPGDTLSFAPRLFDPDNIEDDIVLENIVSAPSNVQIDNEGILTWRVPEKQFFYKQRYFFELSASEQVNDSITTFYIEVENRNTDGIFVANPKFDRTIGSYIIEDFTGDGELEILNFSTFYNFLTLHPLANDEDEAKWILPDTFLEADNSIVSAHAVEIDSDPSKEIMINYTNKIVLADAQTNEVKNLVEFDSRTQGKVKHSHLQDLNKDGIQELIVVLASRIRHSLIVYEYYPNELKLKMELTPPPGSYFHIGNIDDDAQLELFVSDGKVYDSQTWAIQYEQNSPFDEVLDGINKRFDLADYTGDGIDELVSQNANNVLSIYSFTQAKTLATLQLNKFCNMHHEDINADGNVELILNQCFKKLNVFSLGESGLQALVESDLEILNEEGEVEFSPLSNFTFKDIDNDNQLELLMMFESYLKNRVVSLGFEDGQLITESYTSSITFSGPIPFGWINNYDTNLSALFLARDNGYRRYFFSNEPAFLEIDNNDKFRFAGALIDSRYPKFTAIANYGSGVASDAVMIDFSSNLLSIKIADNAVTLQEKVAHHDTNLLSIYDLNKDGADDIIYKNVEGEVNIYSYQDNQVLYNFGAEEFQGIRNIELFESANQVYLLAKYNQSFVLYKKEDDIFTLYSQTTAQCQTLGIVNIDEDEDKEIFCFYKNGQTQNFIDIYEVNNVEGEKQTIVLPFVDNTQLEPDPSTMNSQAFIVLNEDKFYKVSNTGKIIWEGPTHNDMFSETTMKLRNNNGKLEMLVNMYNQMLWFK